MDVFHWQKFCIFAGMDARKPQVYQSLVEKKKAGKKSFAVLVDPDKVNVAAHVAAVVFKIGCTALQY